MRKQLTSKKIFIALKNGKTAADLMEEYSFADETELEEAFYQVFRDQKFADNQLEVLRKNSKKKNSKKHNKKQQQEAKKFVAAGASNGIVTIGTDSDTPIVETPKNTDENEEASSDISYPAEEFVPQHVEPAVVLPSSVTECKTTKNPVLERLLMDEKELSDVTISMENEHKNLLTMIQKNKNEISEIADSITELLQKLKEKKARLTAIKADITTHSAAMQKINGEISSAKTMLADIRAQIAEQRKVVIWVYESAEIEINNFDVPTTLFTHEQLLNRVHELFDLPLAFEARLAIHEAYAIAKLEHITRHLGSENVAFNIVHGNATIQKFM